MKVSNTCLVWHHAGVGDCFHRGAEEMLILRLVPGADAAVMMDVPIGIVGMHHQLIRLVRIEVKYPGLPVVDPDHGVEMRAGHDVSPAWRRLRCDGEGCEDEH